MERAVFKRETIQLKYMDKDKDNKKGIIINQIHHLKLNNKFKV